MDICIVGGGASAVILLHEISKNYREFKNSSITVYEKRPVVGPGLAYAEEQGNCIVNTAPIKMGLGEYTRDYLDWCLDKNKNPLLRKTYGAYLAFKFLDLSACLYKHHIIVRSSCERVERIHFIAGVIGIETQLAQRRYSLCIIASGGGGHEPFRKLCKSARYLPFLHFSAFDEIIKKKARVVGIIGTNQSAIDASLMLKSKGYEGALILFSRGGLLPRVRPDCIVNTYDEALYRLVDAKRASLEEILYFFIPFMRAVLPVRDQDWRQFIEETERSRSNPPACYALMNQLTPYIIDLWYALSEKERGLFKSKFLQPTQRLRGAIPLSNAEKILKLISKGQLSLIKGLADVAIVEKGFSMRCREAGQVRVDYVVNAAGITANAVFEIVEGLIRKGKSVINEHGGIEVDPLSNRLVGADGSCVDGLYAIGYPAKGTCPFVNSIEFLKKFAERIVDSIIERKASIQAKSLPQNAIV